MTEHTLRAHSRVGASSMYRWDVCPASVRMSEGIVSPQTPAAAEGTLAHEVAERLLKIELSGNDLAEVAEFESFSKDYDFPDDMFPSVEVYITMVNEIADMFGVSIDDVEIYVEKKFHLKNVDPEAYGTADCIVYIRSLKWLFVIDYKHGKGKVVEAVDNRQGLYYALGALLTLGLDVESVIISICQPRAYHTLGPLRYWRVDLPYVMDFASHLKESIDRTRDPDAPMVPGDHCDFCPARAICPALQEYSLTIAKEEFSPRWSYDPDVLADALKKAPAVRAWLSGLEEFAHQEAKEGRVPPGYKLVDSVARRHWLPQDEEELKFLLTNVFDLGESTIYTEQKLRSPAQVEKLLPKAMRKKLARYYASVSKSTTLVPNKDARPNRSTAFDEFDVLD